MQFTKTLRMVFPMFLAACASESTVSNGPRIDEETAWAARSRGPGVVFATDFRTQTEFDVGRFFDDRVDNVVWDSALSLSGQHSLRFNIRKEDHANSGNWRVYLQPSGKSFGEGDEFYVQYRIYTPGHHLRNRYLNGGGWKTSVISAYYGSFTDFEVVINNYDYQGYVRGYYRGKELGDASVRFVGWEPRGFRLPKWRPDEWQTILQHVKVGQFNKPNSLLEVWFAPSGKDYTKVFSQKNVSFGPLGTDTKGRPHQGFEALWLLPYDTRKRADPTRKDSFVNYDQVIVSTEFIPAPGY